MGHLPVRVEAAPVTRREILANPIPFLEGSLRLVEHRLAASGCVCVSDLKRTSLYRYSSSGMRGRGESSRNGFMPRARIVGS